MQPWHHNCCQTHVGVPRSWHSPCYVLTLPLLFLIPPCLLTHLPMKHLILGTALLLSLTSLIPFLLTPLTSSLALPQNLLTLVPYYALGHIPLTTSVSSAPIILMGIPQSSSLRLILIRLMPIPWNIPPFATSMSALLITLMVVTDWLSSYLVILSPLIFMDLL